MEIALENFPPELKVSNDLVATVKKVINAMEALYALKNAEVSITLTDNEYIKELNAKYRGKDMPTDVLSFALNEGEEPEIQGGAAVNLLGDIVISLERAQEQAAEYGHSVEREVAFLTVHGMLHLLGYDHIEESDRLVMRREEEAVLAHLAILR